MSMVDKFLRLSKQLMPTGRAFRAPVFGNMEKLHLANARSEGRFYDDATSVLWSILPDNINFTADDAADWERRLGLITNTSVPLADRKLAIMRKISAPGNAPGRSSAVWMQQQLQAAGFNVNVFENIPVSNPATHNPAILSASQHGGGSQHGMQSHYINHVVINSLDNASDILYSFDNRLAFYIGGTPLGTMASVPATRETEFRQLILQLKQAHLAAILYVQYI